MDKQSLTQLGRALRELGIKMIPAYSPQARGRSERSFRTWQGRLPQELRLRSISTPDEANRFLMKSYIREFNRKFTVEAAEPDADAFVPCMCENLYRIFSIQTERTVNRDNTVKYRSLVLQIDKQTWRSSLDGCRVAVYQHLDRSITIAYGPREIGRFSPDGKSVKHAPKPNRTFDVLTKPDIFICYQQVLRRISCAIFDWWRREIYFPGSAKNDRIAAQ